MVLDETLSLRDEGLSAYHQRHVTQGALGVFLRAIEAGRVWPGSVLVVEGLDRLSRAEPLQAQAQLASIVNAGITVVTASDGREYNREGLKTNPMDLVYSLLVMIRAHEESDTKSRRVRAAIRRQCEAWQAGTWRGVIRSGRDPQWLSWDGAQWCLVPERVEAVRVAIDLFTRGWGAVRICRELTSRGLAITDRGVIASQLYRLIRLRALIGEKTVEVEGREFALAGYYPPIVTPEQFAALQGLAGGRSRRKGKGEVPGIVTGLGLTHCGYCGTAIVGQNLRRRPDGTYRDGHRRIQCVAYSHNQGCVVGGSCSVVPIERAILGYCSDRLNLQAILLRDDQLTPLRAALAAARLRVAEVERQLDRIMRALLESDDAPATFAKKATELEGELERERRNCRDIELQIAGVDISAAPGLIDAWVQVRGAALDLDFDARMMVRQLVGQTFERIVVYHCGVEPERGDKSAPIDLLLVFHGGHSRLLRIDRKSGEWVHGEDFSGL